jgi:hypothetical protein
MKKAIITLALVWNLILVLGVIFNQEYALTRAAGGKFETFPSGIRIAYILNTLIVVWQYRTILKIWSHRSINPNWLPKLFLIISLLSAFFNLISRSPNERWNAIPALIIAYGFWSARKTTSSN